MSSAYKRVRALYRAARIRTTRLRDVDEAFSQVVSVEASEDVHGLRRSTCAASDSSGEKCAAGRFRQGEESFEVIGSDEDTLLPGAFSQIGTSFGSSDGRRGTDPALEDAESAGALDEEDAACARSICESHVQVRMRETPVTRPRSSATSAIALPTRFPGSRQTTCDIPHEALSWCSESSASSAASVVSFNGRTIRAIPDDSLSRSFERARLLDAARRKMLAIRGARASLESEPVVRSSEETRRVIRLLAATSRSRDVVQN